MNAEKRSYDVENDTRDMKRPRLMALDAGEDGEKELRRNLNNPLLQLWARGSVHSARARAALQPSRAGPLILACLCGRCITLARWRDATPRRLG